jgi:uridine phosphorylase
MTETLAALGTRRFINLGAAGGLQPGARVGELVVCDGAIRDEGLSHHYLPPARYVFPSSPLTSELATRLTALGHDYKVGPTWTIDAPYRETIEELRHYRDEGVLTVEMEAAALFAVAERRRLDAAAGFVLSDTLSEVEWTPDFGSGEILRGLDILVDAAVQVLSSDSSEG